MDWLKAVRSWCRSGCIRETWERIIPRFFARIVPAAGTNRGRKPLPQQATTQCGSGSFRDSSLESSPQPSHRGGRYGHPALSRHSHIRVHRKPLPQRLSHLLWERIIPRFLLAAVLIFANSAHAQIIILPPVVSIGNGSDLIAFESGDSASVEIVLSRTLTNDTFVVYTITNASTATLGEDYAGPPQTSGIVRIQEGSSSARIDIRPIDDDIYEGTETIVFALQQGEGYLVGSNNTATVQIFDNEPVPPPVVDIVASDANAGEPGNNGEFAITTDKVWGDIVVSYRVRGTATPGTDYQTLSGEVIVPEGERRTVIPVNIINDAIFEGTGLETVIVELVAGSDYTLGQTLVATVNISDDDPRPLPVVSIAASDSAAGEPNNNGAFTVSVAGDTGADVTVSYRVTTASTATAGSDYTALSGTVTIPVDSAGQTSATFPVIVRDDDLDEPNETVQVEIFAPAGSAEYAVSEQRTATVTIADDDEPVPPVANLRASDASAGEPSNNGQFTITLDKPAPAALTLQYAVLGSSTATAGSDYDALSGSVAIAQGQSSVTIPVTVRDDSTFEGSGTESVTIELRSGTGYTLGQTVRATVNISDNDPPPPPVATLQTTDANAAEPTNNGTFTVNLDQPATQAVTIRYTVVSASTATADADYRALSGSVTIAADASSATIPVTVIDDNQYEPNSPESVIIELQTATGYVLGQSVRGTVNIADNDPPPPPVATLRASDANAGEPNNNGQFTVTLDTAALTDVTVQYTVLSASTATAGTDYQTLAGNVTIAEGQISATISVSVIDDNVFEGGAAETVRIQLQADDGYVLGQTVNATVTIADNESPPLPTASLSVVDGTAAEPNDTARLRLTLGAAANEDVTVAYDVGGSAVAGTDYAALSGQLIVPAGETSADIVITPIDNQTYDGATPRTIDITVQPGDSYNLGDVVQVRVTLNDNEPAPLPVASLAAEPGQTAEDGTGVTVTFTLNQTATSPVAIQYQVDTGSTATQGDDFTLSTQQVVIPAGQTQATLQIQPVDDQSVESTETIILALSAGDGYAVGSNGSVTVSLLDNDVPVVSIIASDPQATEGEDQGEFLVSLDRPAGPSGLTVRYEISGSASPGASGDYQPLAQQVTIPAGETSARLPVTAFNDVETEDSESVVVRLLAGDGYQPAAQQNEATVTIADTALAVPLVTVIAADSNAAESGSSGAFVLRLSEPAPDGGLQVAFTLSGSATAGNGGDYVGVASPATIAAGAIDTVVIIEPVDDQTGEVTETVTLTLQSGTGYAVGAAANATLFILDNDELAAPEGGAGAPLTTPRALTIQRITGDAAQTARVNEAIALAVRVTDENGAVSVGETLTWQLDATGTAAGGAISGASAVTDAGGDGTATLTTGPFPSVYAVTVTAGSAGSTVSTTFLVNSGLVDIVDPKTPEGAVGLALDNLCPRLNNASSLTGDETALLARCGEFYTALDQGEDSQIIAALRQVAPEETTAQTRIINRFAVQQLNNITARLTTLRRGTAPVSLSGFDIRVGEETLPGGVFDSVINQRGGAAGGDEPALWKDERISAYVTGNVDLGDKDLTSQESALSYETMGVTLGIDRRQSDRLFIGAALGLAQSDVDLDSDASTLDADGTTLSVYASYAFSDRVYIDGILSFGQNDFDLQRAIRYTLSGTTVTETAKSNTEGDTLALSIGGGYALDTKSAWEAELFGRLDTVRTQVEGYSENNAGAFNMTMGEQSVDGWAATFGAMVSRAFSQSWGVLIPQASASWTRDETDAHEIVGRFSVDTTDNEYRFLSDPPDSGYFNAGIGVSAVMRNGLSAYVNYESVLQRDNYDEESWRFGVRYGLAL